MQRELDFLPAARRMKQKGLGGVKLAGAKQIEGGDKPLDEIKICFNVSFHPSRTTNLRLKKIFL